MECVFDRTHVFDRPQAAKHAPLGGDRSAKRRAECLFFCVFDRTRVLKTPAPRISVEGTCLFGDGRGCGFCAKCWGPVRRPASAVHIAPTLSLRRLCMRDPLHSKPGGGRGGPLVDARGLGVCVVHPNILPCVAIWHAPVVDGSSVCLKHSLFVLCCSRVA
jgi:hypothetical protein